MPGDIVLLKAGDRVPADLRLFKVNKLYVDESSLTGNSLPVAKTTYAVNELTGPTHQKCLAFSGSFVVSGSGQGIVVAHGANTINALVQTQNRQKVVQNYSLLRRRLHHYHIAICRPQDLKLLPKTDVVVIDANLSDKQVADTVRKVQLIKKVPCKFLVTEAQAKRLQNELVGTEICRADELAQHIPRHLLSYFNDCQFIIGSHPANTVKIVKVLADSGIKVLWVSDGQRPMPAQQIAAISLVIGSTARGDVIHRASLVSPEVGIIILPSIFYNKKQA